MNDLEKNSLDLIIFWINKHTTKLEEIGSDLEFKVKEYQFYLITLMKDIDDFTFLLQCKNIFKEIILSTNDENLSKQIDKIDPATKTITALFKVTIAGVTKELIIKGVLTEISDDLRKLSDISEKSYHWILMIIFYLGYQLLSQS